MNDDYNLLCKFEKQALYQEVRVMDREDLEIYKSPQVPRLSIATLTLLVCFAGVGVAGIGFFFAPHAVPSKFLSNLSLGMFIGLGISGSTILVVHGIRRRCFPLTEPGHWLLVSESILLLPLLAMISTRPGDGSFPRALFVVGILASTIRLSLLNAAIVVSLKDLRWKLFFGAVSLVALVRLAQGFYFIGMLSPGPPQPSRWMMQVLACGAHILRWETHVLTIGIVSAVLIDLLARRQRDWLHWLGVLVVAGAMISAMAAPFIVTRIDSWPR